jgi:hypothetical protein
MTMNKKGHQSGTFEEGLLSYYKKIYFLFNKIRTFKFFISFIKVLFLIKTKSFLFFPIYINKNKYYD